MMLFFLRQQLNTNKHTATATSTNTATTTSTHTNTSTDTYTDTDTATDTYTDTDTDTDRPRGFGAYYVGRNVVTGIWNCKRRSAEKLDKTKN